MKPFFSTVFKIILFLTSTFTVSFSQVNWTKHPNPVLNPGPSGSWDDSNVALACVILYNDTLHVWYDGNFNSEGSANAGIGHAISADGINWTKDIANPILTPGPTSFDSYLVSQAAVLFNESDSLFHMWYMGEPSSNGPLYIGHAVSTTLNGRNWIKDSNPALYPGSAGSFDSFGPNGPTVVLVNDTLHMFYGGFSSSSNLIRIGHAISTDWVSWQKDSGPVLNPGTVQDWDNPQVRASKVIYDGIRFHLFYTGGSFPNYDVGYANSEDGISWTKYNDPTTTNIPYMNSDPVLKRGTPGSWDDDNVSTGSVLFNDTRDSLRMWYSGASNGVTTNKIGYATAPVEPAPIADFQYEIKGDTCKFTDLSTGCILNWLWDFGDDDKNSERNPVHIYHQSGEYSVTLTVNGPFESDTLTMTINIVDVLDDNLYNYPNEFVLTQNYPNPFNPLTTIEFSIPSNEFVTLKIFNLRGQQVATLVSEKRTPGNYKYNWHATGFASGVYYYRLEAGNNVQTRKMVYLK